MNGHAMTVEVGGLLRCSRCRASVNALVGMLCPNCSGSGSPASAPGSSMERVPSYSPDVRQPPPEPGKAPHTVDLVTADLAKRKIHGVRKYGVAHQWDNGRDHLWDLYDELLDGAVYVRAEISRREATSQQAAAARFVDLAGSTFADVERFAILSALQRHGGSTTAAAESLGISLRKVQYRLKFYRERGLDQLPRTFEAKAPPAPTTGDPSLHELDPEMVRESGEQLPGPYAGCSHRYVIPDFRGAALCNGCGAVVDGVRFTVTKARPLPGLASFDANGSPVL